MFVKLFKCSFLLMIYVYLSTTYSAKCNLSIRIVKSMIHHPKMNRDELPEGFQTTKDLILANGFGYEEYKVITEDGYVLTTHRMIGNNSGGPPLLIRPGVVTASDIWLLNGRQIDLAFQLADAGFDVWLNDRRGNWYCREHVKYKPDSWEFWNFSFQESGYYDLPAVIDQILNVTKYPQVYYLGHSMGTTEFFVMASLRPEYNAKVRVAALFSPVSKTKTSKEVTSPLLKLFLLPGFYTYGRLKKAYEVASRERELIETFQDCCLPSPMQRYCFNFFALLLGDNRNNVNGSIYGTLASHIPSGSSFKTLLHLLQLFKTDFFLYNYGPEENLILYKNITPPRYPLDKVTAPVALYWSLNDPFINERSVSELARALPNVVEVYKVDDPLFNHIDYLWGLNADKLLYKRVISLYRSFL